MAYVSLRKVKLLNGDNNELDLWLLVKFYDLEGHKQEFIVVPRDMNNPICNILKWLKVKYEEFEELQAFVSDLEA